MFERNWFDENEFGVEDSISENDGPELQALYWRLSEYAEKPKVLILHPDTIFSQLAIKGQQESNILSNIKKRISELEKEI